MKYYLIAGEASGDLHGSNLIKVIKVKDPEAEIRCWGGDRMRDAGGELIEHYKNIAFMGFWEVIKHLPLILKKIEFCKKDIAAYEPDAVVLIDYPGFNLRIAKYVSSLGIRLFYYISPQIWAWKESRIHKIKEYVDRMIVILPFEKEFYKKWGMDVDYVGHPLADVLATFQFCNKDEFIDKYSLLDKPIIAILPGSRQQEIEKMLEQMLKAVEHFPEYQFIVAGLKNIPNEIYHRIMKEKGIAVVYDDTYNLLKSSKAALVTSGTATLETALIGTPQIVCYKGSLISYYIGRMLVKVKFIAMPNLVLNKKFLPELIQRDLNEANIVRNLKNIISAGEKSNIYTHYNELQGLLKTQGASAKAGSIIVDDLSKE